MPVIPIAKIVPWADNDALNTTNVNAYLRDPIRFLLAAPLCRLRQTTAALTATGTWTDMPFTTEDIDTDPDGVGGHSTSANTARFTARYPGWYDVGGAVAFISNATGNRGVRLAINGTAVNGSETLTPAVNGTTSEAVLRPMTVLLDEGDYITLQGFQTSGGALNTIAGIGSTTLDVRWARARVGDV